MPEKVTLRRHYLSQNQNNLERERGSEGGLQAERRAWAKALGAGPGSQNVDLGKESMRSQT